MFCWLIADALYFALSSHQVHCKAKLVYKSIRNSSKRTNELVQSPQNEIKPVKQNHFRNFGPMFSIRSEDDWDMLSQRMQIQPSAFVELNGQITFSRSMKRDLTFYRCQLVFDDGALERSSPCELQLVLESTTWRGDHACFSLVRDLLRPKATARFGGEMHLLPHGLSLQLTQCALLSVDHDLASLQRVLGHVDPAISGRCALVTPEATEPQPEQKSNHHTSEFGGGGGGGGGALGEAQACALLACSATQLRDWWTLSPAGPRPDAYALKQLLLAHVRRHTPGKRPVRPSPRLVPVMDRTRYGPDPWRSVPEAAESSHIPVGHFEPFLSHFESMIELEVSNGDFSSLALSLQRPPCRAFVRRAWPPVNSPY